MQKLVIKGKRELIGKISISGSKNATLPILAASILAKQVILKNIPLVKDIFTMVDLLDFIGLKTKILKWGSTCPKDGENVGLIIGSEIVACPYAEALPKLVQTLSDLMSGGARAIISYKPRLKSEDIFFDLAKEKFNIEWIGRSKIHRDFNRRVGIERIGIFILSNKLKKIIVLQHIELEGLALLKKLASWREKLSIHYDIPKRWILSDALLIKVMTSNEHKTQEIIASIKQSITSDEKDNREKFEYAETIEEEETLSLLDKEIEMIKEALIRTKGKRKLASKELGISERTLYRKIKQHKLGDINDL